MLFLFYLIFKFFYLVFYLFSPYCTSMYFIHLFIISIISSFTFYFHSIELSYIILSCLLAFLFIFLFIQLSLFLVHSYRIILDTV